MALDGKKYLVRLFETVFWTQQALERWLMDYTNHRFVKHMILVDVGSWLAVDFGSC